MSRRQYSLREVASVVVHMRDLLVRARVAKAQLDIGTYLACVMDFEHHAVDLKRSMLLPDRAYRRWLNRRVDAPAYRMWQRLQGHTDATVTDMHAPAPGDAPERAVPAEVRQFPKRPGMGL